MTGSASEPTGSAGGNARSGTTNPGSANPGSAEPGSAGPGETPAGESLPDGSLPGETPRRGGWRLVRWASLSIAVAGLALGIAFAGTLDQDPTLVDTPLIGEPAPERAMPELDGGGTLGLDELRGEVVVVNFWASWCTTCRAEHPHLLAAAESYADEDVTFVGVNFQDRDGPAAEYLEEHGRGDEHGYRHIDDPDSRFALDFGVFGVPETFFLDGDGTIVAKITGQSTMAVLSQTIDDILAGEDPDSINQGPSTPAPEP